MAIRVKGEQEGQGGSGFVVNKTNNNKRSKKARNPLLVQKFQIRIMQILKKFKFDRRHYDANLKKKKQLKKKKKH